MIIDGKIKLKSDGSISRFTQTGLLFEDGSTLDADVVVFATGYAFLTDQWTLWFTLSATPMHVIHIVLCFPSHCMTNYILSGALTKKES
jgi:hypothetical protein